MRKGTGALCTLLLVLAFEERSEGPGKRTPDVSRELYEAALAEALPFPQDGPCREGAPNPRSEVTTSAIPCKPFLDSQIDGFGREIRVCDARLGSSR